jgi:hypothetical protein
LEVRVFRNLRIKPTRLGKYQSSMA